MKLKVKNLIKDLDLDIIQESNFEKEIKLSTTERVSFELFGIDKYSSNEKIKVIGFKESQVIKEMSKENKIKFVDLISKEETPFLLITRSLKLDAYTLDLLKDKKINILTTSKNTTIIQKDLFLYISSKLIENFKSIHGVLLKMYNLGVLIKGESGIGKSEVAIDLLQKGHSLIADDRILSKEIYPGMIIGMSPENIKGFIEVRGVGIVNVEKIFGVNSIINNSEINLIIELDLFEKGKEYKRLSNKIENELIFETKVDKMKIPVKEGRNISTIIEIAVQHYLGIKKNKKNYNPDFLK